MLPILSKSIKNFPSPKIECNYASNSQQKTQWASKKAAHLILQYYSYNWARSRNGGQGWVLKRKVMGYLRIASRDKKKMNLSITTDFQRFLSASYSFSYIHTIFLTSWSRERSLFFNKFISLFPYFYCSSSELPEFTVQTRIALIFLISIGIFPSFSSCFPRAFFCLQRDKRF